MYKILLPLLLLISNISYCQELVPIPDPIPNNDTLEYEIVDFSYLEALDAIVLPKDDEGVNIQAVGLKPGVENRKFLILENSNANYIEVSKLIDFNGITVAIFPPKTVFADEEGKYPIEGEPGDRLGISIRTPTTAKWIEVVIADTPTDPVDPPPIPGTGPSEQDLAKVQSIAYQATKDLQDPITTRYIKDALTTISLSEVLSEATVEIQGAIAKALVDSMKEVSPPYKDWKGKFRQPINIEIVRLESQGKVKTTTHLKQLVDAIVKGLSTNTASAFKNGVVEMYTSPGCDVCAQWKQNVWPILQKAGWTLKEIQSGGTVPRFRICNHGRCSEEVIGYLNISNFNLLNQSLRN